MNGPLPSPGAQLAPAEVPHGGYEDFTPIAARKPKRGLVRAARLGARRWMMRLLRDYFVHVWGMDIHESASFSLKVNFDRTHARGVHVGPDTYLAFGTVVLTHDMVRGLYCDTHIGSRCFIGAHSVILPGVTIGNGSIVGAGSVVTRDVPPGVIVAGNPARVLRTGVRTYRFGCLWDWEAFERKAARDP